MNKPNIVKLKGAYEYNRQPHQNSSKMIVPMAAKAHLVDGVPIEEFIRNHKNKKFEKPEDDPMFDFMISTKIPRSSRLVTCPVKIEGYEYNLKHGYANLPNLRQIEQDSFDNEMEVMHINSEGTKEIHLGAETEQNRVARYFVSISINDPFLIKIMPPLESKPENGERRFNLEAGFHIGMCTNAKDFDWNRLNFDYYVRETEKLCNLNEKQFS